jgi:hypothetical protein
MRIPLWHKVVLFAVFFAAIGIWAWLWSGFVHSLPGWGLDLLLIGIAFFCGVALGPDLSAWWRKKFGRAGLSRRTD